MQPFRALGGLSLHCMFRHHCEHNHPVFFARDLLVVFTPGRLCLTFHLRLGRQRRCRRQQHRRHPRGEHSHRRQPHSLRSSGAALRLGKVCPSCGFSPLAWPFTEAWPPFLCFSFAQALKPSRHSCPDYPHCVTCCAGPLGTQLLIQRHSTVDLRIPSSTPSPFSLRAIPLEVKFEHIRVDVRLGIGKGSKTILSDATGHVRPGSLTAIIGIETRRPLSAVDSALELAADACIVYHCCFQ